MYATRKKTPHYTHFRDPYSERRYTKTKSTTLFVKKKIDYRNFAKKSHSKSTVYLNKNVVTILGVSCFCCNKYTGQGGGGGVLGHRTRGGVSGYPFIDTWVSVSLVDPNFSVARAAMVSSGFVWCDRFLLEGLLEPCVGLLEKPALESEREIDAQAQRETVVAQENIVP